jgi:NTE family protein
MKATGVPIDRYANESVELLRDIDARWTALRTIRDSIAFKKSHDPVLNYVMNAPDADIHVIDVSFRALKDKKERDYLNDLPTSFALPREAVDRLRAAASTIILESPDARAVLQIAGARLVDPVKSVPVPAPPAVTASAASVAQH